MNAPLPNVLARALRDFFADHLPRVRGTSPHTVQSYRDSLVLLLRFVAVRASRSVAQLDLEDLHPQGVIDFLHHLEADRHNSAATRNVRLAAIHAFFRYCAAAHPERLEQCQRVLAVPFKRARSRTVEYLEYEEIQAVLATIDRTTVDGRRDDALLATMFNTGTRVQEVVMLPVRRAPRDASARPSLRQGPQRTALPAVAPDRRPPPCALGGTPARSALARTRLSQSSGRTAHALRRPVHPPEVLQASADRDTDLGSQATASA